MTCAAPGAFEAPALFLRKKSLVCVVWREKREKYMNNCKKQWHWAVYFAVVVCTLFIWHNSLMPATESSAQSMSVLHHLDAVLEWLGLPVTVGHSVLRKLAHMTEFALLGVLWEAALLAGNMGQKSGYSVQSACTLCLLTAMVDETIQVFVPGRGSQVTDVWIDFAGACLGVLAVYALFKVRTRKGMNEA